MHNFEVHSNEITCRKSGRLGLEQVLCCGRIQLCIVNHQGNPLTQHQHIYVQDKLWQILWAEKRNKTWSRYSNQSNRYSSCHIELYRGYDIPFLSPFLQCHHFYITVTLDSVASVVIILLRMDHKLVYYLMSSKDAYQ